MPARRSGRLQHIAYDDTPLNSSRPDIDSRVGWLLAMSRLHNTDPAVRDGRRFVAALSEAGCRASRSLVSRWESGEIPVSYEAMSAYEAVLGLEPGRISSLTGYIRAAIPGVKAKVARPQLDNTSREFSERLDVLIERAEDGNALAQDWQDLGWHLACVPHVHLRAVTWEAISRQLVNRLPRSVRVSYRLYNTAAMNIASLGRAQDFLVDAIEAHLRHPDVQVVTNPLGLLDSLPTRKSARIVLGTIDDPPSDSAFRLAVWLAAQKMLRGDFSAEERTHLEMAVLRAWRRNPGQAGDELAELIASLPAGLRSTLTHAATKAGRRKLGYVVEHGESVVADKARGMAHTLADAARSRVPQVPDYHEDRMLPRLLRETLFHRDSERRHLASLLVSASPFARAVTAELLILLGESTPPGLRARAATVIRYLSDDVHRLRILKFVVDDDEAVAVPMIQALGHMGFNELSDQALRTSLDDEWSMRERAKLYALGMTGSPGLRTISRSPVAPAWQKAAARWWTNQGPAVTD